MAIDIRRGEKKGDRLVKNQMKKLLSKMVLGMLCIGGLIFESPFTGETSTVYAEEMQRYRNVMYYGDWSVESAQGHFFPKDIPADKLTHLNFAFLDFDVEGNLMWTDEFAALDISTDESITEGAANAGLLNAIQDLRLKNPNLKIGVSVGGWTKSGDFSLNTQTDTYRKTLVSNLVKFVEYNEMDFLDIDWEYPGSIREGDLVDSEADEGTPHASEADRENYILLLKEIRAALDELGEKTGKDYELSVALAAGPYTINQGTDIAEVFNVVDFANIMTYDIHGAWENTTNHHTGLYTNPDAPQGNGKPWSFSVNDSVNYYLSNGAVAEKLVIGAAFYSRGWGNVANDGPDSENLPGLFGSADFATIDADGNDSRGAINDAPIIYGQGGRNGGIWAYRNFGSLKETYPDLVEYWDDAAKAPYMYGKESKVFFTFDNERSLTEKAQYVKEKGLGGMITWMQSQDAPAANDSLQRNKLTTAIFNRLFDSVPLPQYEIAFRELAVKAAINVSTENSEGYVLTVHNQEKLVETDHVLSATEMNHRTIKNGILYLQKSDGEELSLNGVKLEEREINKQMYHVLDLAVANELVEESDHSLAEIEPGSKRNVFLATNKDYADLRRINHVLLSQRITAAGPDYGLQSIYQLSDIDKPARSTITFHFTDADGKELSKPVQQEGTVGALIEFTAPTIDGFDLEEKVFNGIYKNISQEYTFVYTKTALAEELGTVTIVHQDSSGKELAESQTLTGKVGDTYKAEPVVIDGYKLKKIPENVSGKFLKSNQKVSFVYEKDAIADSSSHKTSFLPKTGEKDFGLTVILGIGIVILVILFRLKKENHSNKGLS